jgi:hypothetical protein
MWSFAECHGYEGGTGVEMLSRPEDVATSLIEEWCILFSRSWNRPRFRSLHQSVTIQRSTSWLNCWTYLKVGRALLAMVTEAHSGLEKKCSNNPIRPAITDGKWLTAWVVPFNCFLLGRRVGRCKERRPVPSASSQNIPSLTNGILKVVSGGGNQFLVHPWLTIWQNLIKPVLGSLLLKLLVVCNTSMQRSRTP